MKFKEIDLHPTNPIFKEPFTVELRPKKARPIDASQLLGEEEDRNPASGDGGTQERGAK